MSKKKNRKDFEKESREVKKQTKMEKRQRHREKRNKVTPHLINTTSELRGRENSESSNNNNNRSSLLSYGHTHHTVKIYNLYA